MRTNSKLISDQAGRLCIAFLLLAVVMLAGCRGRSILDAVFPQREEDFNKSESLKGSPEIKIEKVLPTPTLAEFTDLTIWIPQQFDVLGDSESAKLLKRRFQNFSEKNPQVNPNVRIKSANGPGSILETLTSASAVAPGAVPSLILISRSDLVQAAFNDLIVPLEGLSEVMDDKDWFDVARDLGAYEGTKYCFPFAANALGLVHDQSGFGNDQPTWSEVLRQTDKLLLPLGDPEALTTIALYLSAGGVIPEKSGLQRLDQKALLTVFSAYSAAARDKRISSSSLDYQNDDQVWAAFLSSNQSFVMTWANHALSGTGGHELANLPGFGVVPYTLAEGWLWCVTEANERDRIHSIALAEYLTAPDFLAIWAPLSGYLPVRPSSIQGYKEPSLPNTILEILDSAHVKPDKSQISKIGIEFKRAISELILEQNPPEESVQNIISRVEEMNSQ